MLLDVGFLFEELTGYEFYNFSEISAVISDKAKCEDGSVLDFCEDVELLVSEGDDVLVLRQRRTVKELEEFLEYLRSSGRNDIEDYISQKIIVAKESGFSCSYIAVINDQVFNLYGFSL